MAKPKKYISSKLKPKRKFLLGGNPEQELYLNDNVTYQAKDGPTQQMQQDFNARQQARAEQMANLQQSMVNQQMMANRTANVAEEERKKKEAEGRKAEDKAAKDKAVNTVTTGASKIGKELIKSAIDKPLVVSADAYNAPVWNTAPAYTAQSAGYAAPTLVDPAMQVATTTTGELMPGAVTVGQNQAANVAVTGAKVAETAGQMSNLASAGTSLGLIAAGEGAGYWAKRRQNKIDEGRGYSDYYSDTHYTGREAAGQIAKSTLKGAGYGVSLGHAVPGIGEAVGAAIGTQAGLMVGTAMAGKQYYDTKGVKVFGKQYGAKNKYDENLDPNVIAERNQQAQIKAMGETAAAMDTARLGSMTQYDTNTGFNLKTTTGQMAKYGGKLEYLKGGVAKSLGRGAKEYVGKKHEQGGIDLPGNIEVEGGETEQNNYIFSATLKLPTGLTYAQAHKNLLASGASSEEIKQLALSQEAAAGRNPNEIKTMKFAKYGGSLQYDKGGKKEPDIVVGGRTKEYWQDLSQDCFKNPFGSGCAPRSKIAGNYAMRDNGFNKYIALNGVAPVNIWGGYEDSIPINTYEEYLNWIDKNTLARGINRNSKYDMQNYNEARNFVIEESLKKDPSLKREDLENYTDEQLQDLGAKYKIAGKDSFVDQYLGGMSRGRLNNLSREEFEYYKGQRNNPDSEIYNPANGTTIPEAERMSAELPGMGTAVEFNTNTPAGEYSEQAAKDAPKTRKGKEVFNRLQNSLKEKAAQKAEANKVYNSNELPEATVTGSKPQQQPVTTETPSNYFTSGQFAADQRAQGPTTIKGRDKKYWQDVECIRDPKTGDCMSSAKTAELQEKFGPRYRTVALNNFNLKSAALSGEINPEAMTENNKLDNLYRNGEGGWNPGREELRMDPKSLQYLERPFTDQEIAYYKGEADSPNTPSYVVDNRLVRETETPSPSMKGKDAIKFERTQPQLAQYNLPNITVNNTSTFVPDEEQVTQNTVKSEIKAASPEFLKEKGFVKQDNGEYETLDADKNLITYDPKTKEYRYITTKKVNTPDGYRMGAAISFSNYDDINKIKTELDTFNKKDFNNAEKTEFTKNLEKKYLGKTSTEETNETEKPKTTTTTNVDASAYKPPVTTQSPNAVTTNPPVTTNTTTTNPPAVTTNTTATNPPVTQTVTTNNPPVTTQTNNPPVTNTNTNMPNPDNNQPKANPTYNTYNMPYQYTATGKGALDYSDPNVAGGIWSGDKYNTEWKPLVSGTMSDAGKADKVISYLENYSGQDAADVKAKIAGKTREEKIAIINRLATDNKVGPFHNAVLEGINTTKETPPPPAPPVEDNKVYKGQDIPEVTVTGEKIPPLPNRPEYKDQNIGWIQGIPAAAAMFSNIKPANYTPELSSQYVQPGAIGRANIGRVSYNTEGAANQGNLAAMNQALQNMSGPGAVAGMLAAKTKADQQSLAIANAEQNQNVGLAAKEAEMNAGISRFNVGNAMQAQTTNAGIGMQNNAAINQSRQYNAGAKMQADMYNLETKLGAGEKAVNTIAQYDMDKRQLKASERYAKATDYSGALNREQVYNDLKRASQDPNNKDFYGKSEAELWDYTRRYDKQMYGDRGNVIIANNTANKEEQKKFGGAKKYVSRLGDLKNVKYKV
jgi:hypothetical protein